MEKFTEFAFYVARSIVNDYELWSLGTENGAFFTRMQRFSQVVFVTPPQTDGHSGLGHQFLNEKAKMRKSHGEIEGVPTDNHVPFV